MIFPKPKEEEYLNGSYKLKADISNTTLINLYKEFVRGTDEVRIKADVSLKKDAYRLKIDNSGVELSSNGKEGIFYAIVSLRQLILSYGDSLPHTLIFDEPDFEKRAYMLDISRCRMPKVETIKKLIDLLAELKYNEFQLYMESFCFKYKAYPKYTADFDCLTPDDIEELDNYCTERFIDLVPNQNCFGHMKHWLATDEFRHLEVTDGVHKFATLNILEPEAGSLVENIFESLLPHFKSKYVNIGLDEAGGLGKYQLEQICREKGKDNVFMDYLNKISELCRKKYQKSVMFWNDMITNYPDTFKRIPEDAIVLNWGYDLIRNSLVENTCRDLKEKGVDYYMCPGNATWISFTGRFDVMSFNLRTYGEIGKKYGAKGYMLTDWGCGEGHMHFPVWSLIPCALASQYSWNVGIEQDGENMKPEYIQAAKDYVDKYIFGGEKVSKHLYMLSQYYLLEPERVHCGTMCGRMMRLGLKEKIVPNCFDISKIGDNFYFDNVIAYMNKALSELDGTNIPEQTLREIILNSKMVILATEFMKIRYNGILTHAKAEELLHSIDSVSAEYKILWTNINYEKGMEDYLLQLEDKKQEILSWEY